MTTTSPPRHLDALAISALDDQARGLAQHQGRTIILPGAAPGDIVDAVITASSHHQPVDHAAITRYITRGPSSALAPCPHAAPTRGRCGGCPAQHLTPDAQRDLKLAQVSAALNAHKIAHLMPAPSWQPAPQPLGYRTRAHYVPGRDAAGRAILGGFAPRSHEVVDTAGCLIVRPAIDAAAQAIAALLDPLHVPLYPQESSLRHVTLRAAPDARWLVDLVITAPEPGWLPALIDAIMALPGAAGASTSLHDQPSNAIRVAPSTPRAGLTHLPEPLPTTPPLTLQLAADGFFQLNAEVAAQMYTAASADLQASVIWDLYCGVGGLGLVAALQTGAQLFGAESYAASIQQAEQHAAQHGVAATFAVCDLSRDTPQGWPEPDLILVNPPRRGLDAPVLTQLTRQRGQLVYMSCNPASFARDAAQLLKAGWTCASLTAHDMLPQTTHVELLSRWTRP